MPAKDLNELIAWLRANPNKASAGIVTPELRLTTTFFQQETGTQFTLVPYRGVAPAMQDLVAVQIDLLFNMPDKLPLMRNGSIKAYAVTGDAHLSLAPDIPNFAELGLPALSYSSRLGFLRIKARQGTSSASSIWRPSKHWPTLRCDLGLPISGCRFSRASGRHQRRSARLSRPMPRNGGL